MEIVKDTDIVRLAGHQKLLGLDLKKGELTYNTRLQHENTLVKTVTFDPKIIDVVALSTILAQSTTLASLVLPEGDTYKGLDRNLILYSGETKQPRVNLVQFEGPMDDATIKRFVAHNLERLRHIAPALRAWGGGEADAAASLKALEQLVLDHSSAISFLLGDVMDLDCQPEKVIQQAKALDAKIAQRTPKPADPTPEAVAPEKNTGPNDAALDALADEVEKGTMQGIPIGVGRTPAALAVMRSHPFQTKEGLSALDKLALKSTGDQRWERE